MFHTAIVRMPCEEMIHGISSASLGLPDYKLALKQHSGYVEALRLCGLKVTILEPDPRFPDSTFVEDVALCTSRFAVLTNPGAPSRNGEKTGMFPVLKTFFPLVERIIAPGTLDAGDVMMVGDHFYIGISERTNHEGAAQLTGILQKNGFSGEKVPLNKMLHLKTGVSYLENNHMLVSGEFCNHKAFSRYERIEVEESESYAANSLWINGTVLVPEGFPVTLEKIKKAGYPTILLDVSEFRKLDGGLSCLSLRF
ncbi:MAG: arginine deiminase family protein [Bacteroidales bacterium]